MGGRFLGGVFSKFLEKIFLETKKPPISLVVSRVMRKIVYGSGRNLLQGAA